MGKVSKALNKVEEADKQSYVPTASFDRSQNISGTESENTVKKWNPKVTPFSPPTGGSMGNWDERLIDACDNFTGVAESFRKLRTSLFNPESGNPPRCIMVLSSDPQEGKSFVCANLGVSFAHSVEQQALMIDCDLRRPSLHKLFGLNYPKGLTNILRHEEDISNMIISTGLPKLSIIPAGSPPDNPSELLSSEKMSAMLKELTSTYSDRVILLDTPPFHAASETLVLSRLVDKIVLVVRWGKSGRENIRKMLDQIDRKKIIGVVFNAFEMNILDRKVQGVGYNNYYSDSYY